MIGSGAVAFNNKNHLEECENRIFLQYCCVFTAPPCQNWRESVSWISDFFFIPCKMSGITPRPFNGKGIWHPQTRNTCGASQRVAKTNKKGKRKSGQKRNMLRDTKVQKYDRVQSVCVCVCALHELTPTVQPRMHVNENLL
jgi:hypothetical protein